MGNAKKRLSWREIIEVNEIVQQGLRILTKSELKLVLFAISKIKPNDAVSQEYTFELSDFHKLCGLRKESHTELKDTLLLLKQKTWSVETSLNEKSAFSWFSEVCTKKQSGTVTVRFDDDMMSYLLDLMKQDKFYTYSQLMYVLPMKSKYAILLYGILKFYQRNNLEWFFEIDDLKKQLNCENYNRFPDFRRFALEPAVAQINEFTDINIGYNTATEGKKVVGVVFHKVCKKKGDPLKAEEPFSSMIMRKDMDEVMENTRKQLSQQEVVKISEVVGQGLRMLSNTELELIQFAILKIKPEDAVSLEYTFELADFCKLCDVPEGDIEGLETILERLSDRSWWATIDDKGTESLVRWLPTWRINECSGKVTIKFHEDMMPYLLNFKEITKE